MVYDDDDIVVVDKPVGVAAHPSPGWNGPTVIGGLAAAGYRISTSGAAERQGIVHRLDVGTSGLMVVAKSERAYTALKRAFRERTVDKRYHALVQGHPDPSSGTIDAPIDRHPTHDYKWAVVAGGRPSVTHYETLEAFRAASLLEMQLETGRTHQIRVHMAALRHPCVGDLTYGADPDAGQAAGPDPAVAARRPARLRAPGRRPLGGVHRAYPADLAQPWTASGLTPRRALSACPGPDSRRVAIVGPRTAGIRSTPTAAIEGGQHRPWARRTTRSCTCTSTPGTPCSTVRPGSRDLFAEAARQGMPAMAMTDHGNVFGAYDFWKQAKAAGVKPCAGATRTRGGALWLSGAEPRPAVGGPGVTHPSRAALRAPVPMEDLCPLMIICAPCVTGSGLRASARAWPDA